MAEHSRPIAGRISASALVGLVLLSCSATWADEHARREPARAYATPAERREAGRSRSLAPWLQASALIETEFQRRRIRPASGDGTSRSWDATNSLQLGLVARSGSVVQAELVLQYESDTAKPSVDEAVLTLARGDWELEAGRMYTPLGQYFSHFPSGPLLEFGETRAEGVALGYAPSEKLELKVMRYGGRARPAGDGRWSLDWSAALEGRLGGGWSLGASYQTDVADAADGLPAALGRRHARRVPAAAAYARRSNDRFELTAELLGALRSFRELPADLERPRAWNLEFVRFVGPRFLWALRLEGSRELEDAPRSRWGIAASWQLDPRVAVSIEYLNGHVPGGRGASDEPVPGRRVQQVGVRLSLAP